ILYLGDRQRLRIFVREDNLCRFIFCLVYVPRDRFDTSLRVKISRLIVDSFNSIDLAFNVKLTDESFARVEFFVRVDPDNFPRYNIAAIERELQEISYTWADRLRNALLEKRPEDQCPYYL